MATEGGRDVATKGGVKEPSRAANGNSSRDRQLTASTTKAPMPYRDHGGENDWSWTTS